MDNNDNGLHVTGNTSTEHEQGYQRE